MLDHGGKTQNQNEFKRINNGCKIWNFNQKRMLGKVSLQNHLSCTISKINKPSYKRDRIRKDKLQV